MEEQTIENTDANPADAQPVEVEVAEQAATSSDDPATEENAKEASEGEGTASEEDQAESEPAAGDKVKEEELVLGDDEVEGAVEALLFASGETLSRSQLQSLTGQDGEAIDKAIEAIKARLNPDNSGVELVVVADKYQLRTKPRYAPFVRNMKAERPKRLSAAALETLSIIAYRQPIVKSDVEKIRGVDVTPTLKTLLERRLVKIVGHRPTVGQPALYGTTEEFLKLFGLRSLGELPTLRDLSELENDPGESSGEERREEDPPPSQENALQ